MYSLWYCNRLFKFNVTTLLRTWHIYIKRLFSHFLYLSLTPHISSRWAYWTVLVRKTLTSSTLSAPTSVSSTRATHVWCLKCSSRTFTISWSTVSSAHCPWGTSAPSCSRWPRPWWSWRAWVSSTLIWSLRTSCWWTPSDSPTGWRSSTLGQPVTSLKRSARLTFSLATTGER